VIGVNLENAKWKPKIVHLVTTHNEFDKENCIPLQHETVELAPLMIADVSS